MENEEMEKAVGELFDRAVALAVEEFKREFREWEQEVLYGDGSAPPRLGILNVPTPSNKALLRHVARVCGLPVAP